MTSEDDSSSCAILCCLVKIRERVAIQFSVVLCVEYCIYMSCMLVSSKSKPFSETYTVTDRGSVMTIEMHKLLSVWYIRLKPITDFAFNSIMVKFHQKSTCLECECGCWVWLISLNVIKVKILNVALFDLAQCLGSNKKAQLGVHDRKWLVTVVLHGLFAPVWGRVKFFSWIKCTETAKANFAQKMVFV